VLARAGRPDEHDQRGAVAGALRALLGGDATLDPVEVARARLGAQVAQLVGDRRGDDTAARDVVTVDDHEAPRRLAVAGQVEATGCRVSRITSATSWRPMKSLSSACPISDAIDHLEDLVDAHRHRRRAELELVVAAGDERLLPSQITLLRRRVLSSGRARRGS